MCLSASKQVQTCLEKQSLIMLLAVMLLSLYFLLRVYLLHRHSHRIHFCIRCIRNCISLIQLCVQVTSHAQTKEHLPQFTYLFLTGWKQSKSILSTDCCFWLLQVSVVSKCVILMPEHDHRGVYHNIQHMHVWHLYIQNIHCTFDRILDNSEWTFPKPNLFWLELSASLLFLL